MVKYQNHHKKGQGLIEILISVGIIMLILGGVVPLILLSLASKSRTFERKEMVELAEKKLEEIINEKQNNESEFWSKVPSTTGSDQDDTYKWDILYEANTTATNCNDGSLGKPYNCADVTVTVKLIKDETKKVTFNRFFAKN